MLHLVEVDTLIICCVSTNGCIRASTLDALSNNYRPKVCCIVAPLSVSQHADSLDRRYCLWRSESGYTRREHRAMHAKMAGVVSEEKAIEHMKATWSESAFDS